MKPNTITTKRGNGQQDHTLYLCSDGVYRDFKAMHAWRRSV